MTDARQTTVGTVANTTGGKQAAKETAAADRRRRAPHGDPIAVVRPVERSRKMTRQRAHREIEVVEELLASLADGGRDPSLLAALARAREEAAIEAQDVLSQADEALVMG